MDIIVIGISYQTSPIEVREEMSFSKSELERAYKDLYNIKGIREVLILDTCNRTEVYAYVSKDYLKGSIEEYLINLKNLERKWEEYFYKYKNNKAVEHIYRVAAGLDSMVVGEDQIIGQVSKAYEKAMNMGTTGKIFNTLFRYVITGAKRIRSNVMGNNPPLSISTIAIQFIKKNIKDLQDKKVFVLGVGKMSTITIQNLIFEGVEEIYVANRTKHKARQLRTYFPQIKVIPYEDRLEMMADCDIIISSTSAPHYIVSKEMLMPFLQDRQMCFIDLSLPRDIEPSLNKIKGITIYTLDDLQQVSSENFEKRKNQAQEAEIFIKDEIDKFWEWYMFQPMVPTIASLQDYYTKIADDEIKSLLDRLEHLDEKDRKLIDTVTRSMAKKLFNIPILQMKEYAKNGDSQEISQLIEVLFKLEDKEDK